MVWLEKLKLKKQLVRSVNEAGFINPKELQLKTLSRIVGGQDVVGIGPAGSGKTTTYVLGALNRFNHAPEGVPRVLILVTDKEQVEAVIEQFNLLNKNQTIRIVGLYVTPGLEAQMDALADGADIVVATPDRARAIYLKLGLNLNKIDLFVVDDADQIIKNGMQLPVAELANSIVKCQRLVFTEVMHPRLEKLIEPFMNNPAIVEVDELEEAGMQIYPQLLYHVPNFGTKLNLLNLFLYDAEVFTKSVVFVNTSATAERVYKSVQGRLRQAVAFLNPQFFDTKGFSSIEEFKADDSARVLIVTGSSAEESDTAGIPFLIHFDIPEEKETFIERVADYHPETESDTMCISIATDLELAQVKKIEQTIGQKIPQANLPEELVIEKDIKTPKKVKTDNDAPIVGAAFHEKKASNAKTYNYSSSLKARMNKKRKH